LYLPGSPQQLRLLLPQIRFYKLEGAYLGSDAWADEAVTKLGDHVTRNAVFPSPFLSATNSEEYMRFAAAYDARFGKRPPRLAALGYDALRLTSLAALEADGDREKLTGQLSLTVDYIGASGEINLSANRENTRMPLYRIADGEALPIGRSSSMAEEEQTE
jgi:ABC-type branched-subunit amino acid transport system substrate-binding protein